MTDRIKTEPIIDRRNGRFRVTGRRLVTCPPCEVGSACGSCREGDCECICNRNRRFTEKP